MSVGPGDDNDSPHGTSFHGARVCNPFHLHAVDAVAPSSETLQTWKLQFVLCKYFISSLICFEKEVSVNLMFLSSFVAESSFLSGNISITRN